jgi:hypothetical protein
MSHTEAFTEALDPNELTADERIHRPDGIAFLLGYLSGELTSQGVDLAELATEIENSGLGYYSTIAAKELRSLI